MGTTADSDKKNEASGIEHFVYHYRDTLGHTYKRLTEDKALSVVYYGGSVTAGYGASKGYGNAEDGTSWACLLTNWLKNNFKSAKINAHNAAIGATGTSVGVYRLKEDVLKYNPDIVFIEFAINDNYCGESEQAAAAQFETLVREIRTATPKCDIVTVLTTDSYTIKLSDLYTTAAAHEIISEHYGISSVNVGQYVWEKMGKKDFKWSDYFIDIVHPNDKGYFEYGVCLSSFLEKMLIKTDYSGFKDADKPLKSMKSSYLCDGERTAAMGEKLKGAVVDGKTKGFNWNNGMFDGGGDCVHNGYYTTKSLNSQISFEFSGTELSVWTNLRGSSKIKYSVDGGEWKEITCIDNSPTTVVKGLSSGKHTITVIPTEFGSGISDFKIHAIFTRDATKQTKK